MPYACCTLRHTVYEDIFALDVYMYLLHLIGLLRLSMHIWTHLQPTEILSCSIVYPSVLSRHVMCKTGTIRCIGLHKRRTSLHPPQFMFARPKQVSHLQTWCMMVLGIRLASCFSVMYEGHNGYSVVLIKSEYDGQNVLCSGNLYRKSMIEVLVKDLPRCTSLRPLSICLSFYVSIYPR